MASAIQKFDIWVNGAACKGDKRHAGAGWIIRHKGRAKHHFTPIVTAQDECRSSILTLAKAYGVVQSLKAIPARSNVILRVCDEMVISTLMIENWPKKPNALESLLAASWQRVRMMDDIRFVCGGPLVCDRPFLSKSADLSRKAVASLGL